MLNGNVAAFEENSNNIRAGLLLRGVHALRPGSPEWYHRVGSPTPKTLHEGHIRLKGKSQARIIMRMVKYLQPS